MENKPEIVFTFPACMGGVASFNYNIINHSELIRQFRSKVVLLKAEEDERPVFNECFHVDENITFKFSYKENQYDVSKRLASLLGKQDGAVVCDNLMTVQAAVLFHNPKTIYHLLHDFFYVKQNFLMKEWVDVAVAHSSFFSDCVYSENPNSFSGRSFYIPYGVKQYPHLEKGEKESLNLVFLGRLDSGKGVMLLHEINKILLKNDIPVKWTIIGKGPLKTELTRQWEGNSNVSFYSPDTTLEVFTLLKDQDIFVFPTQFEGTPVSILESLANGVVPIVSDLPGGIRDIVTEHIGFRISISNIGGFAAAIQHLNNNRSLLYQMQRNCFLLSKKKYDIEKNADEYFELFLKYPQFKRNEKHRNFYFSKLDKKYIPNVLVRALRSLKN